MKKNLFILFSALGIVLFSLPVLAMEPIDPALENHAHVRIFSSRDDEGLFSDKKSCLLYGKLLKEIIKEGTEDREAFSGAYVIDGFGYGITTDGLENYEGISDNNIFLATWWKHEDDPEVPSFLAGIWRIGGSLNGRNFFVTIDPEW